MDRLLTETELTDAAYHRFKSGNRPMANRKGHSDYFVARAQDIKTKRVICEGLAEWWDEDCTNIEHGGHPVPHNDCPMCIEELFAGLRENRLPGAVA